LRTERQALQRHDARRLGDAPLELAGRFEPALLGAHEPEHDRPVVGDVPQRLERAGPLVVVLEKETIEARAPEDLRGDPVISARGVEHAAVVAAADVDAELHAGVALDDRVVELDARVEHPVGIAAALPIALANGLVEQRGVLRRVDLDILAPEPAQFLDLAAGEVDDVGQIGVARRVSAA
jgi:hypothetical protein